MLEIGDLVKSKRQGSFGIVLDFTYDEARDHELIKLLVDGKITAWIRSSWYEAIEKNKKA
jgi:hypothetical protein